MARRHLFIYADSSAVGGCEDEEFRDASLALWKLFRLGVHTLVLSSHTLRELQDAPESVRGRLSEVPAESRIVLPDTPESLELADTYVRHGALGPGARADALHIALATVGRVDVLVSWNFKHIVNVNRIWLFNAVNLERGYGVLEIRSPAEVVEYEQEL